MLSDLIDVERCSLYLYDRLKDELYCKVITGRMKESINFQRTSNNIISESFNTGHSIHIRNASIES